MAKPRAEWACEKVRIFVAPSREKATLLAIAGYCRPDGSGAWCSLAALEHDTGQSRRTIQRHLRALEERGDLVVDRTQRGRYRTSRYYIPCCAMTIAELELLTGVSGDQLTMPLALEQERSETTISELWSAIGVVTTGKRLDGGYSEEKASQWHPKGVMVTPQRCHGDTQTWFKHDNNSVRVSPSQKSIVMEGLKRPELVPYQEAAGVTIDREAARRILAESNPELAGRLYGDLGNDEDAAGGVSADQEDLQL